jgi:hypothetical protein
MSGLLLLFGAALAGAPEAGWGALRDTAGTVGQGAWVVRTPLGRSSVGLGETTDLVVQPFDIRIGGTRVGVEQTVLDRGAWTVSVLPSIGEKWSLGRTSLRADVLASVEGARLRGNAGLGVNMRLLRQTTLSETATSTLGLERVDVPLTLSLDLLAEETVWRVQLRTPLHDEGAALGWVGGQASWIHRFGRVYLDLGLGVLVGRPTEHVFLGEYLHPLVVGYPRMDLWFAF